MGPRDRSREFFDHRPHVLLQEAKHLFRLEHLDQLVEELVTLCPRCFLLAPVLVFALRHSRQVVQVLVEELVEKVLLLNVLEKFFVA